MCFFFPAQFVYIIVHQSHDRMNFRASDFGRLLVVVIDTQVEYEVDKLSCSLMTIPLEVSFTTCLSEYSIEYVHDNTTWDFTCHTS